MAVVQQLSDNETWHSRGLMIVCRVHFVWHIKAGHLMEYAKRKNTVCSLRTAYQYSLEETNVRVATHANEIMYMTLWIKVSCYTMWWFYLEKERRCFGTRYTRFGLPYFEFKVTLKGAWSILPFNSNLELAETASTLRFPKITCCITTHNVHTDSQLNE